MRSMWKAAAILLFILNAAIMRSQDFPSQTEPTNKPPLTRVRISGGVMAGLRTAFVQPVYPPEAMAKHIAGTVALHALVSKEGTIEHLEIISGPVELQAASIEAVRQWKYKPYLLNGQPVEVDTVLTVNFNLSEAPPDHS